MDNIVSFFNWRLCDEIKFTQGNTLRGEFTISSPRPVKDLWKKARCTVFGNLALEMKSLAEKGRLNKGTYIPGLTGSWEQYKGTDGKIYSSYYITGMNSPLYKSSENATQSSVATPEETKEIVEDIKKEDGEINGLNELLGFIDEPYKEKEETNE